MVKSASRNLWSWWFPTKIFDKKMFLLHKITFVKTIKIMRTYFLLINYLLILINYSMTSYSWQIIISSNNSLDTWTLLKPRQLLVRASLTNKTRTLQSNEYWEIHHRLLFFIWMFFLNFFGWKIVKLLMAYWH